MFNSVSPNLTLGSGIGNGAGGVGVSLQENMNIVKQKKTKKLLFNSNWFILQN